VKQRLVAKQNKTDNPTIFESTAKGATGAFQPNLKRGIWSLRERASALWGEKNGRKSLRERRLAKLFTINKGEKETAVGGEKGDQKQSKKVRSLKPLENKKHANMHQFLKSKARRRGGISKQAKKRHHCRKFYGKKKH